MLFKSIFTLALAAVAIAAPTPAPVELEDRATSFDSIRIGLTVVITSYRSNPSIDNRYNLCRIINGFSPAQRARLQQLGFDFSRLRCPSVFDQLNAIQPGLGAAYQAYQQNPNRRNTNALCAFTSQLSRAQRSRIASLGITINVQCGASITTQLNAIQANLGTAYQAYQQNQNAQTTAALCAITTQLTAAQRASVTALGVTLNPQCPTLVDQLNNIQPGLGQAYQAYIRNPNRRNTNALCAITTQLSAAQQSSVAALNVNFNNVQCTQTPTLTAQLNAIQANLGTAYQAYQANQNAQTTAALCAITTQLTAAQQASVAALNVNLANVQCPQTLTQQLNTIAAGFGDTYATLAGAPTVFANQLAFCQARNALTAQQTTAVNALNLAAAANVNCPTVILQNRLNTNFLPGLGDAYVAFQAAQTTQNRATLCNLVGQLNANQRARLLNNQNIDVTTFGCN
ncbi:hypothetical protein CYLTODRAFT_456632 [Cylindrobasidium torrendii FP15055 ss-10]|uniref:Uncharacterized protein n=1 Tax=Cylindrobasidium torrendii FP15055 ss-10 TaxID=1314674 RepID=A0A0D7B4H1_9AGAR|nr:hypothetical protein CYLTODRAFT_456632 [Cylindrobasidium torrendii FP15055 ss-10]